MPMIARFVQGRKARTLVPKENTRDLSFKIDGNTTLKVRVYSHFLNDTNPPKNRGKKGRRKPKQDLGRR